MKVLEFFLSLSVFLALSGCSIAPFSSTTSGRTAGAGNFQFDIGNVNNNFNLRMGTGLSPNFDMGFVMEFGSLATTALFAKYAITQDAKGPSLAMEIGYGASDTTSFSYAALVGSLAFSKNFELFAAPRINSIQTDSADVDLGKNYGNFSLTEYDAVYLQLAYGFNIFFNKNSGLSIYSTYFNGENIETTSDSTFGANFLFNI
ncbi:MAG: hypothetical protein CME65_04830 [Halobacteriovoraceae bacterium]|nr:hypothetical protein [Halobacteriovoraceae bacterium]|tara:strand:+ start:10664 stop:11272 length:609 start_codon:yes stop_codon:yes gene_type:complete